MKKILVLLISLLVFNVSAETTFEKVKFEKCVDGDTVYFKDSSDEKIKYRFLAIDTPETVHPTKEVEAYGKDASEYTCNRLTNASEIVVELESGNKTDKYGRKLGWIWVDGSLLQQELIEAGYAEVAYIYGNYKYTNSLCLIQQDAKTKQLGIWHEGSREEGYCSTVDLTDITNEISFDYNSSKKPKSKDKAANEEELFNMKKASDITDQINDFIGTDKFSNIILYGILGLAFISIVVKSRKN